MSEGAETRGTTSPHGEATVALTEAQVYRKVGIGFAILYVVEVGGLALWKAAAMPQADRLPWAEVVYGPAIMIASCILLWSVGYLAEVRIRRHLGRHKDAS
ncbi:hypothetical protein [Aquisphaera insulae]|uniref:hypothetical protein n=1 Tax=Aquisphaera insulae TaxID=2712864 RepID=UPI0013EB0EF2|nr:hypothetical protein [Aquisphaera insulae]